MCTVEHVSQLFRKTGLFLFLIRANIDLLCLLSGRLHSGLRYVMRQTVDLRGFVLSVLLHVTQGNWSFGSEPQDRESIWKEIGFVLKLLVVCNKTLFVEWHLVVKWLRSRGSERKTEIKERKKERNRGRRRRRRRRKKELPITATIDVKPDSCVACYRGNTNKNSAARNYINK